MHIIGRLLDADPHRPIIADLVEDLNMWVLIGGSEWRR